MFEADSRNFAWRLRCQEDLRFNNFRPPFGGGHRGTEGGGGGVRPNPPPLPPPFRPPPPPPSPPSNTSLGTALPCPGFSARSLTATALLFIGTRWTPPYGPVSRTMTLTMPSISQTRTGLCFPGHVLSITWWSAQRGIGEEYRGGGDLEQSQIGVGNLAFQFGRQIYRAKSRGQVKICFRAFGARGCKLVFWECPPNLQREIQGLPPN